MYSDITKLDIELNIAHWFFDKLPTQAGSDTLDWLLSVCLVNKALSLWPIKKSNDKYTTLTDSLA